MIVDPAERPAAACPACRAPLTYVETEVSFDAFRRDRPSAPQTPIHHYDCDRCRTCWTLGKQLERDPLRETRKGEAWTRAERPPEPGVDSLESSRLLVGIGVLAVPSVVLFLAAVTNSYVPRSILAGRQWLIDSVGIAILYGAGFSILCAPLAIAATIWNFRRMTPRDQNIAVGLALLASGGPLLVALFFYGISMIR